MFYVGKLQRVEIICFSIVGSLSRCGRMFLISATSNFNEIIGMMKLRKWVEDLEGIPLVLEWVN